MKNADSVMTHAFVNTASHPLVPGRAVQYIYPPAFDVNMVNAVDSTLIATVINATAATKPARSFISWNLAGAWSPVRTTAALEGLVTWATRVGQARRRSHSTHSCHARAPSLPALFLPYACAGGRHQQPARLLRTDPLVPIAGPPRHLLGQIGPRLCPRRRYGPRSVPAGAPCASDRGAALALGVSTGGTNVTVAQYRAGSLDGDVYVSRNGGLSFKKTLDDVHYCRFLDQGTVTVCVPGYEFTTRLLYAPPHPLAPRPLLEPDGGVSFPPRSYSLDQGQTWTTVQFTSTPIDVAKLLADPSTFHTNLIIYGTFANGSSTLIAVDMDPLLPRACTCAHRSSLDRRVHDGV